MSNEIYFFQKMFYGIDLGCLVSMYNISLPYAEFMQKICRTFPHTAYVHKRKNRKLTLIGGARANGSAGGKWGRERERGSNKYRRRVYCRRECFLSHHNAPWTFQQSKLAHLDLPYICTKCYFSCRLLCKSYFRYFHEASVWKEYTKKSMFMALCFVGDWLPPPLPLLANIARNGHLLTSLLLCVMQVEACLHYMKQISR